MTLVGDAAHVKPTLGTGVNLAMLDAAEPAEALVTSNRWQDALGTWESQMHQRAETFAQQTRDGFREMFSKEGNMAVPEHIAGAGDLTVNLSDA